MSRRSPALTVYRLATRLAQPLAPLLLRERARRGKEDPARLNERLGRPLRERPAGRLVWLHGASVGESLALLTIVERALARRPDASVLITAGTRTAQHLLAQRLPATAIAQYAPLDTPLAVAGFLDHWRPDLGVVVESELWPNLLARSEGAGRPPRPRLRSTVARQRGWVAQSAPRGRRPVLDCFDLILARGRGGGRSHRWR